MRDFNSTHKLGIICLSLLCSTFLLFSFKTDPNVLQAVLKKMQRFHSERPQEKLYLHFDKPFYAAGEDIWYKAYLVEASLHNLDSQSRVVYVELLNDTKTILQRKAHYVAGGVTFGDLQLSDSLEQGNYFIRAYTNYMKNIGEDFFFVKEFSILNSNDNNTSKIEEAEVNNLFNPDSIDLQFFPEGGNLVACGAPNRLGFKALSPDGKSMTISGEILDESKTVVASFNTEHDGMGSLKLNPLPGKTYYARITKPYPVNRYFPLPVVNDQGYIMQVDEIGKNIKVVIFSNVAKPASGKLTISLVVQSRGKVYYAQLGAISGNAFFTYIPRSKFPDGISQITLFDSEGKPVAERIIHQDQNETIEISLRTEAQSHGKRQPVIVYADAMYRNGDPAKGNFSVTVYDENLLQSAEKYPLTINNYLSLTSELRGHIENPGYYFKDSLSITKKHLDLLMMVHGWRRFTWQDVLHENLSPQKYFHEKGLPISGKVLKAGGKKAPVGSNVKIMTMNGSAIIVKPDSLGRFYSDGLIYYDSMDLVIQTENEKGKKQPYKFLLNPFNTPPSSSYSVSAFKSFDASSYLKQRHEEKLIFNSSEVKVLKEVEVVEKRESDSRLVGFGTGSKVLDVKKLGPEGYTSIFQMLQSRVPGVMITGSPPAPITIKVRGKDPAFLVNGMVSTPEIFSMITPSDVEFIEVLSSGAVMYGASSVINVALKAGAMDRVPIGINQIKYPGFYKAREFYSPRYDVPDDRHNLPDKRTTLYWEPLVETDSTGKVAVTFYTADIASRYRIVMEGITPDGYPGTTSITFEVK